MRQSTLVRLEEMGFGRSTILRAIRNLRTNDVMPLASYLLENPFLAMEADDPPAAESSSATVATADPVAAATEGGRGGRRFDSDGGGGVGGWRQCGC